jgi:hypothetical protein
MPKFLIFGFILILADCLVAQSHWQWTAGLENHFQLNKSETKNIESSGNIGNMPRVAFSAGEGVAINLGISRYNDSSNLTWSVNIQRLWGNLVSAGSQRDSGLFQEELLQSKQTNLKLGVGYQNKGKYKYAFQAGPIIPIGGKHITSIYYEGGGNQFAAHYTTEFSSSIGLWFGADYRHEINEKTNLFLGLGFQIMNRDIKSRSLDNFIQLNGSIDRNTYAPSTYQQEYQFVDEIKTDINDAVINPSGYDINAARELQTQNYSFSSIYLQLGVKYALF